jgi:hypothetical protein
MLMIYVNLKRVYIEIPVFPSSPAITLDNLVLSEAMDWRQEWTGGTALPPFSAEVQGQQPRESPELRSRDRFRIDPTRATGL